MSQKTELLDINTDLGPELASYLSFTALFHSPWTTTDCVMTTTPHTRCQSAELIHKDCSVYVIHQ